MKFLEEPQIRIDDEGEKVLYIVNTQNDIYRLKKYKAWKNLHIAQEPGGHYSIIKSNRTTTGFVYKKVQFVNQYLIAYYKEEMDSRIYIHIYDENGVRVKFKWEIETIEENSFIFIPESDTRYFVDSDKKKAYSKYHPKYWIKRLY